jgi:hypothetical protein
MATRAPTPVPITTIADYHRRLGLPAPVHPLVSVSRFEDMPYQPVNVPQVIIHPSIASR